MYSVCDGTFVKMAGNSLRQFFVELMSAATCSLLSIKNGELIHLDTHESNPETIHNHLANDNIRKLL